MAQLTSHPLIDKVSYASGNGSSTTTLTVNHTVSSPGSVLLVAASMPGGAANNGVATFNGVPLTIIATQADANNNWIGVWYGNSPPIGNYPVSVIVSDGSNTVGNIIAYSITGIQQNSSTPQFVTFTGTTQPTANTITPSGPSMLIDFILNDESTGNIGTATPQNANQTMIMNIGDGSGNGVASSYVMATSNIPQLVGWSLGDESAFSQVIIALKLAKAPSIWNPNVNERNSFDVISQISPQIATFYPGASVAGIWWGESYNLQYWKNSFFHTIGRIIPSPPTQPAAAAELERPTSQIIIDKVFQGQLSAQALSQVTLSLQVLIPSQNAVLVLTGGSVISTGAPFSSVTLDGNPLTQLIQAAVGGVDAEIWWYPFPAVGSHTLTIVSGTGGEINANAMVILGIDRTSTNLVTASATDSASTSTILVPIIPTAPNSLIIDTLSALDALTPVPDQSQNQVFNATHLLTSEDIISTYKIGNNTGENMNYNLGVAVNAALVAVAFRPAHAASIYFPNVNIRTIDDTVDSNGLDAGANPPFGNYGYKPSQFYLNSFFNTIGRYVKPSTTTKTSVSTLLLMGMG